MAEDNGWVFRAQRIADDILFPAATAVEQDDRVVPSHLKLLMDEGFYGLPAPVEYGGVGLEGLPVVTDVIAALAGGCLTTAFVWLQHLLPLIAVAEVAQPHHRERWLGPMASGEVRAGLAMAHPELIQVRKVGQGYTLTGESAWVTGWGMVDKLLVGGVDERNLLHIFLIDAVAGEGLSVKPVDLIAVQASRTVSLRFVEHFVPGDRLGMTQPFAEFMTSPMLALGAVMNGFLALGVAGRCARLLETDDLEAEIAGIRLRLLTASPDEVPEARAHASMLAARAAARLVVHTGSRSVLADQHAGRLYRESGFLLVFGLRPAIKERLLQRLSTPFGASV